VVKFTLVWSRLICVDPGICISPENENLSNLQPSIIIEQININVIGTLLVSQAIAPLFHCGTKLVNTSSMVASFATTIGLPISTVPSYSISKAALNMLTVKQALFYADCIVVALDPGLVKTDMNPEGQKSAEDVATSIITVVDGLAKADSGCFVSWEGKKVAW
jgi:NAD(P)-dependent dehydrogenase (short-subunit alcohol dehydrogenase family)